MYFDLQLRWAALNFGSQDLLHFNKLWQRKITFVCVGVSVDIYLIINLKWENFKVFISSCKVIIIIEEEQEEQESSYLLTEITLKIYFPKQKN